MSEERATFEFWDTPSGNLLAEFDTLDEALAFLEAQTVGMPRSEARALAARSAVTETRSGHDD